MNCRNCREIRRDLYLATNRAEKATEAAKKMLERIDSERVIPLELTQGELWRLEYALGYLIVSSEMPLDGDTCILRDKLIEALKEA